MNRFQITMGVLILIAASAVTAQKREQTSQSIKAEDVKETGNPYDVEFCKLIGNVRGGFRREDRVAAGLGANVVLKTLYTSGGEQYFAPGGTAYYCSAEDMAKQGAARAALQESGSRKIDCTAGSDCELKWSRVTEWLLENSKWKFRTATDTLITTEGPMDTDDPSFEAIKMASGDGKTYQISVRASCGRRFLCIERSLRLRAKFADFVSASVKATP